MIHAAREVIVVADGSKIGAVEAAKVCAVSEVDVVITDASAGTDHVIGLEQAGTTVHCV
jgi:DeoR family transcriptional regulator of aga operon